MADIIIKQEAEEEAKGSDEVDIKKTLADADEYQKLKEANDKLEAEYIREQNLKAKRALGGKSQAGNTPVEKTQEDIDKEKGEEIANQFF